jgi:DNA-binding transcriptional MerR regulator
MVDMPVTTLRVWERRYGLGGAETTASGHRLYAAADVERLALIKRLTQMGHAIGSIALLDMPTLQQVAATHATTRAHANQGPAHGASERASGIVVVGEALALRMQRAGVRAALGERLEIVHTAASQPAARRAANGRCAAWVIVAETSLHDDSAKALLATARAWGGARVAVVYGYGSDESRQALRDARIELLRGAEDDTALVAWLDGLLHAAGQARPIVAAPSPGTSSNGATGDSPATWGDDLPVTPRRYDDMTLTDFAGLSSTIACECPRHVAELLMQLSNFELYSESCASRNPEDAALHDYLHRVAGGARSLFEQALERVAVHEGLVLKR